MNSELSKEQNIQLLIDAGVPETKARLIVGIETGEIDGDVETLGGELSPDERRKVGLGRSMIEGVE